VPSGGSPSRPVLELDSQVCSGGEATIKAYWITAGVGTLVAVIGAALWLSSNGQLGFILVLSGLVIAVFGLVMRLVQWGIDKSK
jgi:hypothetical protein